MGEKKDIFISITMSLILIALVFPVKAFDEDLLLYLSFNEEDDVVKDETDKTTGGTIVGGVEWVEGKFGSALEVDGAGGFVEIEQTPELIFAAESSFTAEVWVKTDHQATTNNGVVGTYGPQGVTPYWLLQLSSENKFRLDFRDDASSEINLFSAPQSPDDGEWHHVVCIRDREAEVAKLYFDGELVDEKADITQNIDNGQGKIWIGNHLDRFWPVAFDEVRIWGKVLSDAEIAKALAGTLMAVDPLEKLPATWGKIKVR